MIHTGFYKQVCMKRLVRMVLVAIVAGSLCILYWQSRPPYELALLSMEKIEQISGTRLVTAQDLLTSKEVAYICSVGPYYDAEFEKNGFDKTLLIQANISPVPEGDGFLIFYSGDGRMMALDRLKVNIGSIRWIEGSKKRYSQNCFETGQAAFKISRVEDHWTISLEKIN
jgi:hypothetical protein